MMSPGRTSRLPRPAAPLPRFEAMGESFDDKLFVFGALQLRRREDIVPNLGNADALTLPLDEFCINAESADLIHSRITDGIRW